jgi:hypothetical protein
LQNALMSGTGDIQLPDPSANVKGERGWRPGWASHLALGAVGALVSWAMYGPAAGTSIVEAAPADLTWANVAAAVLIGIGGSRWLSAEVDKNVFKQTAVEAANSDKNPDLAATIARETPSEALEAAVAAP